MREADHGARIVLRIVAMLVNEAIDAVRLRVAAPHDIEHAMTRGVNYPRGLLAWGDEIGPAIILHTPLGTPYGPSGFMPGYVTEARYYPAQRFAVAFQVSSSGRGALGRSPGAVVSEIARRMIEAPR